MAKKERFEKEIVENEKKYIVDFQKRNNMRFPIVRGFIYLEKGKEISKDDYNKLPVEFREKFIKVV